jgi:hypothetical protein
MLLSRWRVGARSIREVEEQLKRCEGGKFMVTLFSLIIRYAARMMAGGAIEDTYSL